MVVKELKRVSRVRKEFQDLKTRKFDARVKGSKQRLRGSKKRYSTLC